MIRPARRDIYRYSLFALLLAALTLFLLVPLGLTVAGGMTDPQGHFTFRYLLQVFDDPRTITGLFHSLSIATFTTFGALLLALPLAILWVRYDFPGRGLLSALVLVPLILPPFVGAIGLRAILGRFGALNSLLVMVGLLPGDEPGIDFLGGAGLGRFWGVVIMEVLHLYPILYLNLAAALANLDPTLEQAAQNLGATRWQRFTRISLPLILPGIFAGGVIVFIWSFTELGTPLMFDYEAVTPVQVFWGLQEIASSPQPYALVVVMLLVAVGLYALARWLLGGRAYEMRSKASIASSLRTLRGGRGWLVAAAFLAVTLLAVMPHLGVVLSAFTVDGAWYRSVLPRALTLDHFRAAMEHPLAVGSIRNSLFYASCATLLAVLAGLALSYLVVRAKVRGGFLLDSLAMLPLAVPGLVIAFGYVAMSLRWPFSQWFDIVGQNANPVVILIIAYAVRRLPYVVRSVSAGLEQTSGELEEAARNLGAGPLMTLRKIVLPLIMANIVAGAILAFSFAMLEVSDSLILAQKDRYYPITKAIYELFNRLGDGPYIASAMGVWGMALLGLTMLGASLLLGKKLGAIFRV